MFGRATISLALAHISSIFTNLVVDDVINMACSVSTVMQ